jgi:hypothetical protein
MIKPRYGQGLLDAADKQWHRFLRIRGAARRYELSLAAKAGLVEATVVNRLTDSGPESVRAFQDSAADDSAPPGGEGHGAYQAAVLAKWHAKFALGLQLPPIS